MDHEAMLPHPLAEVFGHLAAPAGLTAWLPEVTGVQAGAGLDAGIGTEFGLQIRRNDQTVRGTGELIAYEPPWCVAYRLRFGPQVYILRLTCTANGTDTRVQVHQADGHVPLAVDLARLEQAPPTAPAVDDAPAH